MTPITNISLAPSTNVIMNTPPPALTYTSNVISQKQLVDVPINKPASSTLVDLLKQRRSPPPLRSSIQSLPNNSLLIPARQPKATKQTPKKSQAQLKRLAGNSNSTIQVN
jgi:hypothetical protein